MKFSLIVPIASDKQEYADKIPYVFDSQIENLSIATKAISGLDLSKFDAIYFTILEKHRQLFKVDKIILDDCDKIGIAAKTKICVLERPTANQPETIYETIKREAIIGSIMIKDADNFFRSEVIPGNYVTVFPLDALTWVNPQDKCYVQINDTHYLTNIIEKKIISRYFCTGGYFFENTQLYCEYFQKIAKYKNIHLSNIIYLMLLEEIDFKVIHVKEYLDWGTYKDFVLNFNLQ
jgi:hypothetical protein